MNLVVLGGGTGLSRTLAALKTTRDLKLKGICTHGDDGGSSGQHSRDYGIAGYMGDLMKCFLALSPESDKQLQMICDALSWRYVGGQYDGLTPRNAILMGLLQKYGLEGALDLLSYLFKTDPHKVMPVATQRAKLVAILRDGRKIEGESDITTFSTSSTYTRGWNDIQEVFFEPPVPAYPPALEAIRWGDAAVIAAGSWFTSTSAVLLGEGVRETMIETKIPIIVILNLVAWERDQKETDGYRAEDFINDLEKLLGRKCDVILYSHFDKHHMPLQVRERYARARMVDFHSFEFGGDARLVTAPLRTYTSEGAIVHDIYALRNVFQKEILPRIKKLKPALV